MLQRLKARDAALIDGDDLAIAADSWTRVDHISIAREAFGPAIGFQVGWLHVWMRLFSCAALLNVFVAYLGCWYPSPAHGPDAPLR